MVIKRNVLSQVELMPISDVSDEMQSNTDMSKLPTDHDFDPAFLNSDSKRVIS